MNEKQLSKEEIQQIFQFVEKNGVKFYDIQLEVVDHLASDMEHNWESFPSKWIFEQKILDACSRIKGGLHAIQMEKEKAFEKWFNAYCFNYVKSFFSWPKIGISFLLIFLVFTLISGTDDPLMYGEKLISYTLTLPILLVSLITLLWQFVGRKYKYSNMIILSFTSITTLAGFQYLVSEVPKWLYLETTIASIFISISYVILLYYTIAFLLAFNKCYKNYKMQFPRLT